jgi:hypothetical protein
MRPDRALDFLDIDSLLRDVFKSARSLGEQACRHIAPHHTGRKQTNTLLAAMSKHHIPKTKVRETEGSGSGAFACIRL